MKTLSPRHRTLAGVMLLVLAVWSGVLLFAVRPLRQQCRDEEAVLEQKRTSLRRRGWPLEQERLNQILADRRRVLEGGSDAPGLNDRAAQVMTHATSMFRQRLRKSFASDDAFVRNASNIDFREAFNALQRRLSGEGIWLAPEVLNLSETTSTPYTYQLMLQVWTLDRLADLVLDHGLAVVADPGVTVAAGRSRHPAARISMLPLTAYYVSPESRQPYLLEIPVRLRLKGPLNDVRRFLSALTAGADFIPPVQVELYAADPADSVGSDGVIAVEQVVLDLVCGAFFAFPYSDAPGTSTDRQAAPKPGA